jgi:integrase
MRIYARGAHWYADIRGVAGVERTRRAVGAVSEFTQEQATVEAYKLAAALQPVADAVAAGSVTFHTALLVWLRLKTRGRTDKSVVRVICDEWPDCPLEKVTNAQMAVRLGDLEDGTYDRYLSVINAALNAVDWPKRLTKRNTPRGSAPRYLSAEEWARLKPALPAHLLPAVEFALATGLRRANVFGLEWPNVNIDNRTVTVWAQRAKGKRTLHLPLSDWAIAVLQGQVGKHELVVFPYSRTTSRGTTHKAMIDPKTAWGAALATAGINDFRWHDLRHTWATWSVQAGMPLKVLQELGGWATLDMVLVYAHAAPSVLQGWANAVSDPSKGHKLGDEGHKGAHDPLKAA